MPLAPILGPKGRDPFKLCPITPGPLGHNDCADPDTPDWFVCDTPGSLGAGGDGADPNGPAGGRLLLAYAVEGLPDTSTLPAEYSPDLGTTSETVQMYDKYFVGPSGPLLKSRIEAAAREVEINPGLLAAALFAEDRWTSYTKRTGEVDGWDIGVDDYTERKADMERKIPAARQIKPIRYGSQTNENGRVIPNVPVLKAEDAVLATACYLKYGEIKIRAALTEMGGAFDRLPVEYRFALTRYVMNAGPGATRKCIMQFLGIQKEPGRLGKYVQKGKSREFLQFKPWKTERGIEQFIRKQPRRAATAHTAQAIHLSQKIFGVNPAGTGDSLLFFR